MVDNIGFEEGNELRNLCNVLVIVSTASSEVKLQLFIVFKMLYKQFLIIIFT